MNSLLDQSLARVRYSFTCESVPDQLWEVRRVHLEEALSQPYELIIDLLNEAPELDPEILLAGSCQLSIDREGVSRTICGVVARVELHDLLEDRQPVRLIVVPALKLLGQRLDTRLWQNVSALDVVEEVLRAGLADYQRECDTSRLARDFSQREYVVQYHESDLALVARLLEDEGVAYHFDHEREGGVEVLVLDDTADYWDEVPTLGDDPALHLITTNEGLADVESIQRLTWARALRPTSIVRRSFDWLTPTTPGTAEVEEPEHPGPGRPVYHHGRILEPNPQPRVVRELVHARAGARVLRGSSNLVGLGPGRRFRLDVAERPELDGQEFLVTRVTSLGDVPDVQLGQGVGAPDFVNEFECEVLGPEPWLPPLTTPIPCIHGPQTAIVTGPEGEEIHTDEHGRVKVRFDWDREHGLSDDTSMWIRVAHGWAGPGFGALFIPRIGMEVVVEWISGSPDRPLITGCVYNGDSKPSIALPDNKTQSTIRTCSSPGAGGFNELRFEDAAGAEEIFVHAQRDLRESVGRNRTETIKADHRQTVDGEQHVTVHKTRKQTVDGDETLINGANRTTTITAKETLTVTGETKLHYNKNVDADIVGFRATKVGPKDDLEVAGDLEYSAKTLFLSQSPQAQASLRLADAKLSAHAQDSISLDADKHVGLTSSNTLDVSASAELSISGGQINIKTGDDTQIGLSAAGITIMANQIEFVVGASSIAMTPSGITIQGPIVTID